MISSHFGTVTLKQADEHVNEVFDDMSYALDTVSSSRILLQS